MEASTQTESTIGPLSIGGIDPRYLMSDTRGLMRLALMVGTVFDRMTSFEDEPQGARARR